MLVFACHVQQFCETDADSLPAVVAYPPSPRALNPQDHLHPMLQSASQLVFPSNRHQNKAVCAVAATAAGRQHLFTFCLERVLQGPLNNCWLTVGVRKGDYANC